MMSSCHIQNIWLHRIQIESLDMTWYFYVDINNITRLDWNFKFCIDPNWFFFFYIEPYFNYWTKLIYWNLTNLMYSHRTKLTWTNMFVLKPGNWFTYIQTIFFTFHFISVQKCSAFPIKNKTVGQPIISKLFIVPNHFNYNQ